ncbi:not available [Yersinia enterocolitica]|nr:not available [Yersinia enterocolitica]
MTTEEQQQQQELAMRELAAKVDRLVAEEK